MKRFHKLLSIAFAIIKSEVMGVRADAIIDAHIPATVTEPKERPPFNEWCKLFNVSKNAPKKFILSKEQIAERFGINSSELIIS
jgi:hypothetical protein